MYMLNLTYKRRCFKRRTLYIEGKVWTLKVYKASCAEKSMLLLLKQGNTCRVQQEKKNVDSTLELNPRKSYRQVFDLRNVIPKIIKSCKNGRRYHISPFYA